MLALLTKKDSEKKEKAKEQQRGRDEINLDQSEGESCSEDEGNEVMVLKPKTTKSSSSKVVAGSGSTIDKFYKPASVEEAVKNRKKGIKVRHKVQTALTTQKKEEWRDRACEYICQYFYEASIPHNTVTLPSFANMVEAIGAFGRGLRGLVPMR